MDPVLILTVQGDGHLVLNGCVLCSSGSVSDPAGEGAGGMGPLPMADLELLGDRLSATLGKDLVRMELDIPVVNSPNILNRILKAVSSRVLLAGEHITDENGQLGRVLTICGTRSMAF